MVFRSVYQPKQQGGNMAHIVIMGAGIGGMPAALRNADMLDKKAQG